MHHKLAVLAYKRGQFMQRSEFIIIGMLTLVALGTFAGCIPIKQHYVSGGQGYDSFNYNDGEHSGLLKLGASNAPSAYEVVDAESYAIAPKGTRFGIETRPYGARPEQGIENKRNLVYLVRENGKRVRREWEDGVWQFVFVVDGPSGREIREFEVELRILYYNPFIHGAPN